MQRRRFLVSLKKVPIPLKWEPKPLNDTVSSSLMAYQLPVVANQMLSLFAAFCQ